MSKKLNEKISTVLSIPQEVISDVPRIVFESNTTVSIENFKGISEYSDENIKINASRYVISLVGEKLQIKSMTGEEVVIQGIISSVEFA